MPPSTGLNLTWETLEGLVKHNGPLTIATAADRALSRARRAARRSAATTACTIWSCGASPAPRRRSRRSPTTSPMTPTTSTTACAPGFLPSTSSPRCRWWATFCATSAASHPSSIRPGCVHELIRGLITRMIEDVIAETDRAPAGAGAALGRRRAPCAGARSAAFSPAMAEADRAIKGFLYPRMYRHARIMRIMGDAERVVCELFDRYIDSPGRSCRIGCMRQEGRDARCAASPISSPA